MTVEVPDLSHGTAGIGVGQLHQWLRTGDDRFLARAVLAAEHLVRTVERSDAGLIWPVPASARTRLAGTSSYGYAHGTAGIATFLGWVAAASAEEEFATVATEALDGLLAPGPGRRRRHRLVAGGPRQPGVLAALVQRLLRGGHRPGPGARPDGWAPVSQCAPWPPPGPGWLIGGAARPSSATAWPATPSSSSIFAACTGEEDHRSQARQAAASLWLRRRDDGPGLFAFPDDTGGAVSAAFGTGLAGVGSVLPAPGRRRPPAFHPRRAAAAGPDVEVQAFKERVMTGTELAAALARLPQRRDFTFSAELGRAAWIDGDAPGMARRRQPRAGPAHRAWHSPARGHFDRAGRPAPHRPVPPHRRRGGGARRDGRRRVGPQDRLAQPPPAPACCPASPEKPGSCWP